MHFCYEPAIDQADDHAADNDDGERGPDGDTLVDNHDGRDDRRKTDNRALGQVDALCDDDQGLADDKDADHRDLLQNVVQISYGYKARRLDCKNSAQKQQDCDDADAIEHRAHFFLDVVHS